MTFTDLLAEVEQERAWIIVDRPVGPSQVRLIIVQREDGSVWEAEDMFGQLGQMAVPWSLVVMERMYASYQRGVPFAAAVLDIGALGDYIAHRQALDAAEKLLGVAR